MSTHPKVYIIEDFFSEFEANSIIEFAKPRAAKSTVGQGDSGGVRKSDTAGKRSLDLSFFFIFFESRLKRCGGTILAATKHISEATWLTKPDGTTQRPRAELHNI